TLTGAVQGAALALVGGTGADTFTVNPSAAPATIGVTGLGGADLFNLAPGAASAYSVAGGDPAGTLPGDVLNVDLTNVTAPVLSAAADPNGGLAGSWTFGNARAVNFSGIEVLTPAAGLAVTVTDGGRAPWPGATVTYTILMSNAGPSTVTGATLTDVLPAALLNVAWTATASAGSSVSAAAGTGNVGLSATLAANGSATVTVTGTVDPSAVGSLV